MNSRKTRVELVVVSGNEQVFKVARHMKEDTIYYVLLS